MSAKQMYIAKPHPVLVIDPTPCWKPIIREQLSHLNINPSFFSSALDLAYAIPNNKELGSAQRRVILFNSTISDDLGAFSLVSLAKLRQPGDLTITYTSDSKAHSPRKVMYDGGRFSAMLLHTALLAYSNRLITHRQVESFLQKRGGRDGSEEIAQRVLATYAEAIQSFPVDWKAEDELQDNAKWLPNLGDLLIAVAHKEACTDVNIDGLEQIARVIGEAVAPSDETHRPSVERLPSSF